MIKKPKVLCVTGGKGGTGKTLIAINLSIMFKNHGKKVLLIDGDVENPNTYLLLGANLENQISIPFFKPIINVKKCTKCGLCSKHCATHALLQIKDSYPVPILTVCSGCKLCYKICPEKAIQMDFKTIGWTYSTKVDNIDLIIGELKPSEARSAAIVENLLIQLDNILEIQKVKYDIIILDTAPGAHCDVELLINKADYVIPVTEPTKFGKLDLLRITELINLLHKPHKTIVNRSSLLGFKDEFLEDLKEEQIEILGDIPLDDDIVKSYCQGKALMSHNSNYSNSKGFQAFKKIYTNLKEWIHLNDTKS
ncbi:MAG: AAA family ATPase [Candidatus Lokiarchaeota archaeon]